MLENWCWEPRVLEKMSSHFERKEPLPADLIEKIIKRWAECDAVVSATKA